MESKMSPRERENQRKRDIWASRDQLWANNRAERGKRTTQQQLDVLDFRLGKNDGAVKERKRLKEQIKN